MTERKKTKHTEMAVYGFELYLPFPSNFNVTVSSSSTEKTENCSNRKHLWQLKQNFQIHLTLLRNLEY